MWLYAYKWGGKEGVRESERVKSASVCESERREKREERRQKREERRAKREESRERGIMNSIKFDLISDICAHRIINRHRGSNNGTGEFYVQMGTKIHPFLAQNLTALQPDCHVSIRSWYMVSLWNITPWISTAECIDKQENVHHRDMTRDESKYTADIFLSSGVHEKTKCSDAKDIKVESIGKISHPHQYFNNVCQQMIGNSKIS